MSSQAVSPAVSEATVFPSHNNISEALVGEGTIDWQRLSWEQNPTQFHIVNALADLPVLEHLPAIVTKGSANLVVPERLPRVLDQRELRHLLDGGTPDDEPEWRARRDAAVLEVLYASGVRVSELCTLQLD